MWILHSNWIAVTKGRLECAPMHHLIDDPLVNHPSADSVAAVSLSLNPHRQRVKCNVNIPNEIQSIPILTSGDITLITRENITSSIVQPIVSVG